MQPAKFSSISPLLFAFQYPLRVEVGCNLEAMLQYGGHDSGFSTLYGSKWVATFEQCAGCSEGSGFSTLYGSKWVATPSSLVGGKIDTGFSTLYGSKWVATLSGLHALPRHCVSVPSTGRSGLQLCVKDGRTSPRQGFSTLYGSKWVATACHCRRTVPE